MTELATESETVVGAAPKRAALRILFAGPLGEADSATDRRNAMVRLGHQVLDFDMRPYVEQGGPILKRLRFRTQTGFAVHRLNRDLLAAASRFRPDVAWFDKAVFVARQSIAALRAAGIYTVHQMQDNPFGPRDDPHLWRRFLEAMPEYDLHLVPRDSNLAEYRGAGARAARLFHFAYEPTLQYAPAANWSDADRSFDVIFIGSPYDDRPQFLVELWRRHGIATRIWGDRRWERFLPRDAEAALWQGGPIYGDAYREAFWRARICLSFVTHSNCDEVAHRSFEIAACGGFLLAEDMPAHRALFADGAEAVFFASLEECAAQIRRYLPDEPARTRIAAAGRRRAETSGYSNDARIAGVLQDVSAALGERKR